MVWVYLSPHFDDAVFSCGGLIREQTFRGDQVEIWTICAGDIPPGPLSDYAQEHHLRWESGTDTVTLRRKEDENACSIVGASSRYFPIPDCIYRRAGAWYWRAPDSTNGSERALGEYLYPSNEALFGPLHPAENDLILQLSTIFNREFPPAAEVVCPLSIGGHVDHRLVRLAAEKAGRMVWYYADYPYAYTANEKVNQFIQSEWETVVFQLSTEAMKAWKNAAAAYISQISTFWEDEEDMRNNLEEYYKLQQGCALWKRSAFESYH